MEMSERNSKLRIIVSAKALHSNSNRLCLSSFAFHVNKTMPESEIRERDEKIIYTICVR